jgi:chromosome segregation ATPase
MTDATNNSGGDSPSRLDRIEALLASTAERLDRVAASQSASSERLSRIETNLERTEQVANSNARSVQAWEAKFQQQDRDIDRLALVAGDIENGTRTLAIAVRDIFSLIMDRLEAVEARLPDEGSNGGNGGST